MKERVTVLSYDIREEIFRLLPDLDPVDLRCHIRYELVNFRDSLAVMFYNETLFFSEKIIDIYTFDERCKIWSKMSIGPFKFCDRKPIVFEEAEFLGCLESGDTMLFFCHTMNKEYCANLQNYTIRSLENEGDLVKYIPGFNNYSESLVFIDGMKPFSETEDEIRYRYMRKE